MKTIACPVLLLVAACTFPRPDDVTFGESAITIVDGDHQTGVVDTTLPVLLKVNVTDADFIPIPNFTVEFSVRDDNGTLSSRAVLTDAQGNARTELKLGTRSGEQIVDVWGEGIEGDAPVFFTATALADVPAKISAFAGDGESATVATQLAAPLVARVEDRFGNPSPAGLDVTFAVTSGGGSLSASSATAGADGTASTQLTLGTVAGAHTVDASAPGLAGTTFTITGLAAAPATIERTSPEALLAEALRPSEPMIVTARDTYGNPAPGATITFTKTAGTGTIATPAVVTDANGQATGSIVADSFIGTNSIKATAEFVGTEITFTATTRNVRPAQGIDTPGKLSGTVAVGDINMDGLPDLVALTNINSPTVFRGFTVYLNTTTPGSATTTFSSGTQISTSSSGGSSTHINIVDATGDGLPDVLLNYTNCQIFANTTPSGATTPTFANPVSLNMQMGKPMMADMNGDQLIDIVTLGANSIYVCPRTGAGLSFGNCRSANIYLSPSFQLADLNGDGKSDITGVYSSTHIYTHVNTSAGTTLSFDPVIATPNSPMNQGTFVDINGDTKPDWITATSTVLRVLLNTSAATPAFTALPDISTPGFYSFVPMDLNGDGLLDLVGAYSSDLGAMLNAGTSTSPMFTAPARLLSNVGSNAKFTVADFNKDGRPDLVSDDFSTSTSIILAR